MQGMALRGQSNDRMELLYGTYPYCMLAPALVHDASSLLLRDAGCFFSAV